MKIKTDKYKGYVIYCRDKQPLGVISSNGERRAICNSETIPKKIKQYLTAIEDRRFYQHGALDIRGIARAFYKNIKARKIVQGGSTITQQLARNILRDNRKNVMRKIKEILLAIKLENKYSKDQILELYLNNVFWGKNNYGLRTASLVYFSKEPEQLNTAEQIALLTFLRGPNYYLKNEEKFFKRCDLLSQTLYKRKVLSSKKIYKIKKTVVQICNNNLEVFRNSSVPYIAERVNGKDLSVITTLNKETQLEATKFIANCKYPTSIIGIANGKIIAVASSNGTNHPFTFKTNAGSTLKPFIYTFLRENGVGDNDLFPTTNIYSLNWDIREVQRVERKYLSLKGALLLSNNNAFVNASYHIGIKKVLFFLAKTTNKPVSNLVPASILGATIDGITLNELANMYYRFFLEKSENPFKRECISILKEIAIQKFECEIYDAFLKTGTTNFNKERFAIVGFAKTLFGFLRQGNETDDYSKEGNFLANILSFLKEIRSKIYKWE